jgi:hypothetical protein
MDAPETMVEEELRTPTTKVGYPELCRRCDRTVAWARSLSGKRILMDFYPAASGRYVIVRTVDGFCVVRRLAHATPNPELTRFTCHFDTCPKRKRQRPTKRTMPGHGLTGPHETVVE